MPRTSTLEALPADLRERLTARLLSGGSDGSYDAIVEWLQDAGHDVSRSAVGRYAHRVRQTALEQAREIEIATRQAEVIVGATGGRQTEIASATARLLQSTLLRIVQGGDLDESQASQVALGLQRTLRSDESVERMRRETTQRIADRVREQAPRLGLGEESAAAINAVILGGAAPATTGETTS